MQKTLTENELKDKIKKAGWAVRAIGLFDMIGGALFTLTDWKVVPLDITIINLAAIFLGAILFYFGNKLFRENDITKVKKYLILDLILMIVTTISIRQSLILSLLALWYIGSTMSAIKKFQRQSTFK